MKNDCASTFDASKSQAMRKLMKDENTRILVLIVFYYNTNYLVYKVLGVVIYFILEHYVCINYLCLQKENKLSLTHKLFEENLYDNISGIGITEMLLNIVSCYVFYQEDTPTATFMRMRNLVSYYLSKSFLCFDNIHKHWRTPQPGLNNIYMQWIFMKMIQ